MATCEYKVISYVKRNGDAATRLALCPLEYGMADYCEPGCTGVKDAGTVQIMGDTDMLSDTYVSE